MLVTEGIMYGENKYGMEGVLIVFAAYYMRLFQTFSCGKDLYVMSKLLLSVQSELSLLMMHFGTAQ